MVAIMRTRVFNYFVELMRKLGSFHATFYFTSTRTFHL